MKTERNSKGLKKVLFSQIDDLVNGKITPQQAKAVASLSSQVVSVAKLEMEAARFISDQRAENKTKQLKAVEL